MDGPNDVTLYLDAGLLESARGGKHNFLNLLSEVLRNAGLTVHYTENTAVARMTAERRPGYALYHMEEPIHDRALTLRRSYFYPFWHIEGTNLRWDWDVALSEFDEGEVDRAEADRFFRFWQRRLFQWRPFKAERGDYIYVPLQGLIRQHRSFQHCSPIDMLAEVARRYPDRQIKATLHPNEDYTGTDRMALAQLIGEHPRVELVNEPMEWLLQSCDFVVTENSGVAFKGFFFRKPAVLFAAVDFHHIAGSVMRDGLDAAFAMTDGPEPDYAGYVWWFLQVMAINAGREDAKDKIAATLRGHGWPV